MLGTMRNLARNRRGNAMILFAAVLPLIIGSAGLAADTIQWTLAKRQLQRAADSAAIAGVYARVQGQAIPGAVTRDLQHNHHTSLAVLIGHPAISYPPNGTGFKDAVKVAMQVRARPGFFSLFISQPPAIRAEATAAIVDVHDYCVIALESDAVQSVSLGGTSDVRLGCGLMANSPSSSAVGATGNTQLRAAPIAAFGSFANGQNFGNSELRPYSPIARDPFAGITPTAPGGACKNDPKGGAGQTISLTPGCYKGLTLQGAVTLQPGTYYIDGGDVRVNGGSVVVGNGVTIVLSNSSPSAPKIGQFDVGSGASVNLTPPTTGTYAGITVFQDRRAPNQKGNKIGGSATLNIAGAFYFPNQELEFGGASGMTLDCVQIVARRVSFQGSMDLKNDCSAHGGVKALMGSEIRLVA